MSELIESIKASLRRIYYFDTTNISIVIKNIIKEHDNIKNNLNKLVNIESLESQYSNMLNAQIDEMQKSIFDKYAKSKYINIIINNNSTYVSNDEFIDYYFIYKFHEKIVNIYKGEEKIFKDLLELYDTYDEGNKLFCSSGFATYFITFEKIRRLCERVKSDFERLGIKLIKCDGPLVDIDKIGNISNAFLINVDKLIDHNVKLLINSFDIKENKFITNDLEIQDVAQLLIDFLKGEDGPMSLLNLRIERLRNRINESMDDIQSTIDTKEASVTYSQCYEKIRTLNKRIDTFCYMKDLYKKIKIEYNKYKAESAH